MTKSKTDSNAVNAFMRLGKHYLSINIDSSSLYYKQAIRLADNNDLPLKKAESLRIVGYNHFYNGNHKLATAYFNLALKTALNFAFDNNLRNRKKARSVVAATLQCHGLLSNSSGAPDQSLSYFKMARALLVESKDEIELCALIGNEGNTYLQKSDYPNALECFFSALKLAEKNVLEIDEGNNHGNIGNVYMNLAEYEKAKEHFAKTLVIATKHNNVPQLCVVHNAIANVISSEYGQNIDERNFLEAKEHYKLADELASQVGNLPFIAHNYSNLASLFYSSNKLDSANYYYKKALDIAIEVEDPQTEAMALLNLGQIKILEKDFKEAKIYLEKARATGDKGSSIDFLKDCELQLSRLYELTGKDDDALLHYQKYQVLNDSIENDRNIQLDLKQEIKYDYEKKALADSVRIAEEKKITGAKLKMQQTINYGLIVGLILILIFSIFMINRYRVINKQKQIIEVKDIENQQQNEIIRKQKHLVEEKQKEIIDSITYARRIQRALITSERYIEKNLRRITGNL